MHIVVFVKPVVDPARLRAESLTSGRMPVDGVDWALNPYDEYALEAALRMKDSLGLNGEGVSKARVSVIAAGAENARETLKKTLAVGADDVTLLCDPALTQADSAGIARALAAVVTAIAPETMLILCGNLSLDAAQGVTAAMVAQTLNFGFMDACKALTLNPQENSAHLTRQTRGALETWEQALPAVVAFIKGDHDLRTANIKGVMRANKTPIRLINASEAGLNPADLASQLPQATLRARAAKAPGVTIIGEDPHEAAARIKAFLKAEKIL
ncbi:MAG: electron transfer flavoprotein subunit beta/FixA family protein [Vampirovibrionales bacterium]|nr:electron transfer flavoprotein subunit beta/FixA family protein [Vampirovibrionales bacterium]